MKEFLVLKLFNTFILDRYFKHQQVHYNHLEGNNNDIDR